MSSIYSALTNKKILALSSIAAVAGIVAVVKYADPAKKNK